MKTDIEKLTEDFKNCQKVLAALGDENRQHLILEMMKMEKCSGARVGDITERIHLSRPAVSRRLQILKDAGILKVRKEATKNYYYCDPNTKSFDRLIHVLQKAKELVAELPDRSGEVSELLSGRRNITEIHQLWCIICLNERICIGYYF